VIVAVGRAFTVTAAVAVLVHPFAPVPVTVYIVFVVVEEVTVEPVVAESPVAGDHT
jgi:hypothetical protein